MSKPERGTLLPHNELDIQTHKRAMSTMTAYTLENCDSCGYRGPCVEIGEPPVLCRKCLEAAVEELRKMEAS